MLIVVGKGRMNLGQVNRRVAGHDFVGIHAHPLIADRDMLDLDAVAVDAWLAATSALGLHNPYRIRRRTSGGRLDSSGSLGG
jgi:hypothetical protein